MNSNNATYGAAPKRFQMPLCDKILTTEISNDYTLPDYQPEIRRVLRVDASILPPAKYVGGSQAEFNGTVDYHLLYVGQDGCMYSAPLSAEYSFNAPLDISSEFDLNEGVVILADTRDENITTRVSGPRKLTIKCRLCSRVRAYGMMIADERCSGEVNPMSVERLMGECECSVLLSGFGDTIVISDEINTNTENMRVISASANVCISDVTASAGTADCRGDIELKLLVCRDESTGTLETLSRKISFGEQVEIDDISPDSLCSARAYVNDIGINVEEGRILCDLGVIPEIRAYGKNVVSYTRDIYSTENSSETAYRGYTIPSLNCASRGNFSQSERIPVAETSISQGSRIIDVCCKPHAESFEFDKNKAVLLGECKYFMLIENEGEFSSSELILPFRYEAEISSDAPSDFSADMSVLSCRARIDGGNLCIDSELSVSAEFFGNRAINVLSEVRFGEMVKKSDGDIVICFPAPDDTPWSVAKKYSVPVNKLSGISSPSDDISGINYLVVNM